MIFKLIHYKKAYMEKEKVITILNDLLQINHDRVEGYTKAIDELKEEDTDLKVLFNRYITQSHEYAQELISEISRLGGNPSNGTTNSGKIYRVWMDLKAAIKGKDRKTILENCEFGEDAAQKAYDTALNSDVEFETTIRDLLVKEKSGLKSGHDEIKKLRDAYKTV
jgi:uncharacterized protein (TIGR02284 family)